LFNFTDSSPTNEFYEVSDTARSVGMSKGVLTLTESETVRRAVFFALLNPQDDGACFAGVETQFQPVQSWDSFKLLTMQLRGQGAYDTFKVILHDKANWDNSSLAFEHYFQLNVDNSRSKDSTTAAKVLNLDDDFQTVSLPLSEFVCSYRGQTCDANLDTAQIQAFGWQAAGGRYETFSQKGVSSLEINWVTLE